MGFSTGDQVANTATKITGTVAGHSRGPIKAEGADWPIVDWEGWGLVLTDPSTIEKVNDRDALAKVIVTAEENTPYKEQIHLQSSNNTTIPAGYTQAEPGSPVFLADATEGRGHHIYREFDRSTNEFQLHFELDLDRDMSPAEAIGFAQNILKLAVPMQEDQLTRATAVTGFPSWAETSHYDEETNTFSGRGPSIQLNDDRQKWDIHSNWFEGGDEQFTLAKRYTDLDDPTETPGEYFSFSSRDEVLSVMAGLVNLLAATTEGTK
ncbi:hypothetical protein ART_0201 [Arthrobacter sp. PAMC 25486]|uniref:hypothetical protein n=1 Tax=Arthrobacter sp. PAMC 25486 TaxID=1494608 RepID=UPI000536415A|nr:hypothetical protein [Arthrobacter sp. PAMC 25486]AIX99799.1 hypothetical protein ART_0201 [Arthrobacter sp. PAMC 25486]